MIKRRKLWLIVLMAIVISNSYSVSFGWGTAPKTYHWNQYYTRPGIWNSTNNWSPNGIPSGADYAYVNNGGTVQIFSNAGSKVLYLGYNSGESGNAELYDGGSFYVSEATEFIGYRGTGTFTQTGGTNRIRQVFVGYQGIGTYNLIDGSLTVRETSHPSSFYIGEYRDSQGTFNQSGGSVELDCYLVIGSQGAGAYNLSGGSVYTSYVIHVGNGTFTQTGGSVESRLESRIGSTTSSGMYVISGGHLKTRPMIGVNDTVGIFKVIGSEATFDIFQYTQYEKGTLITQFDANGISQIVEGASYITLGGRWEVTDPDEVAPNGRFTIMVGNISGAFSNVILPNETDWSWGIDEDSTVRGYDVLWVEHVPEPPTLLFLLITTLVMWRKKKRA